MKRSRLGSSGVLLTALWLVLVGGVHAVNAQDDPENPPLAEPESPAPEVEQGAGEGEAPEETVEAPAAPEEPESWLDVNEPVREPNVGDEVIVTFQDGRRMNGVFVSRDESTLVVKVRGVELKLPASTVSNLVALDPPPVRYERMRKMVDPQDVQKLTMLAEWCRRHGMYDEALTEVERALAADQYSGEAQRLKQLIEEQRALAARPGGRRTEPRDADSDRERPRFERRPQLEDFPLLTPEQINLIKVYEIDLRDAPRLIIRRETISRLLQQYGTNPLVPTTREGRDEMYRKDPAAILDLMFRLRARELYSEVEVVGNPRSMQAFRDNIQGGWLVNAVATTRCHGGRNGGRLLLTNRRPTSEESMYTNFYIISQFKLGDGTPLINWDDPELSPLLQMGLPARDSMFPHPQVEGWRPIFRTRDARSFRLAVSWIRMMYRPRPAYDIPYAPPRPLAPIEPAESEGVER